MEWQDRGIILANRPHGEADAILTVLTAGHGAHKGLVKGGQSRKRRGDLQPGNEVVLSWRARLSEHLGQMTVELDRPRTASLMGNSRTLAGLNAVCAVTAALLPEREPQGPVFAALQALLDGMESVPDWPALYVRYEVGLLAELGFPLDLGTCAATGSEKDLIYVSPRTGRAVSAQAGAPYQARMLALPGFLRIGGPGSTEDIRNGLTLTAHFFAQHSLWPGQGKIPPARMRFADYFAPAK